MKLGFYYHAVANVSNEGSIKIASYIGTFIAELAKNVDELLLFTFTSEKVIEEQNYILQNDNITLIDLGRKPKLPYVVVLGYWILKKHYYDIQRCDRVLVRAPSPLAPHFYFLMPQKTSYLLVGDYLKFLKHMKLPFLKKQLTYMFLYVNDFQQKQALRKTQVFTNSLLLKDKYKQLNSKIDIIKTTVVYKEDIYQKMNLSLNSQDIKLLFVGNVDKTKGFEELTNAMLMLHRNGYKVFLDIAGWDRPLSRAYIDNLVSLIGGDYITFHGFKSHTELLELYRSNDIFVLPSYEEGFPRVIWEAMASSLPVISTNVGSIPYFLTNEEHILIIPPKDVKSLYDAILRLVLDDRLRVKLIQNSLEYIKDVTIEHQTKLLVNKIAEKL